MLEIGQCSLSRYAMNFAHSVFLVISYVVCLVSSWCGLLIPSDQLLSRTLSVDHIKLGKVFCGELLV